MLTGRRFLTALVAVSSCLGAGVAALPTQSIKTAASLVRLGFGTIDPRTAINGLPNALLPNVLVANLPQVILSMLYFTYNALFTSFLLSYEWVSYAHKRKGLRVSRRAYGEQRDTYFLQLPYRFGLPLMALSGLLHWLVSQSIFLIAIDMYNAEGQPKWSRFSYDDESSFMTCGYSPIAMITVLIIGIFMVGGIVAFGFVSYKQGMPLAGSCSMAIASACHLDNSVDSDGYAAAEAKLQWGVTGVSEDGVGHCSFSTKEVSEPVEGQVYAGIGWQNLTHDAQSQVLQDVKQ